MAVLTVTFTVPDSHATMLEVLGMNATQIDVVAFEKFVGDIIEGSQISTTLFDLDGSPTVTVPK